MDDSELTIVSETPMDQVDIDQERWVYLANRHYEQWLCSALIMEEVASFIRIVYHKGRTKEESNYLKNLSHLFFYLQSTRQLFALRRSMEKREKRLQGFDKRLNQIYASPHFQTILKIIIQKSDNLRKLTLKLFNQMNYKGLSLKQIDDKKLEKIFSDGYDKILDNSSVIFEVFNKLFFINWQSMKQSFKSSKSAFKYHMFMMVEAMGTSILQDKQCKFFKFQLSHYLHMGVKQIYNFQQIKQIAKTLDEKALDQLIQRIISQSKSI